MPVSDLDRKAAKAAYDRTYRVKNAEKLKVRSALYGKSEAKKCANALYRETHKAEIAAYKKVWHAENAGRIAAQKKAKHLADPSVRKAESRRDYLKRSEAIKTAARLWVEQNPERKKASDSAYHVANSEKICARARAWRVENPERKAANDKAWSQNNPLKVKLNVARRHKRVRQATPVWVSRQELDDVYLEAAHMQLCVDHIIPLKNKLVCGLHVPWNLQLLSRSENARKSNKFDVEAPNAG